MTTMAATDAKNRFGELLEKAMREPVEIQKQGRPVAMILSMEEYRALQLKSGVDKEPDEEEDEEFLALIGSLAKTAKTDKPADVADYYAHLEEKYGK